MNTLSAQEIKRRGITAVEDIIADGDVYVITKNEPRYVVVTESRYRELIEAQRETEIARVRASLEELHAGKTRRFSSSTELLEAIESEQ